MNIAITTAPCCRGVDDVRYPNLPTWERVFDEVAAAGYKGLELGPYGYVPHDLDRVGAALNARGLSIVAGTIFDDLVSRSNRDRIFLTLCDSRDVELGDKELITLSTFGLVS